MLHRPRGVTGVLLFTMVSTLSSFSLAEAQWVFVARKALQVINTVAGEIQGAGQPGTVDAATVLLEADADKVYAAAIQLLRENRDLRILSQDDPRRTVAFARGTQSVSMKISPLGDHLAQILVAGPAGQAGGASVAVEGILRVCHQMKVECSRSTH